MRKARAASNSRLNDSLPDPPNHLCFWSSGERLLSSATTVGEACDLAAPPGIGGTLGLPVGMLNGWFNYPLSNQFHIIASIT